MSITVAKFRDVADGIQPGQFMIGDREPVASLADLDPVYKRLLDEPVTAVVAVTGSDGQPNLTPVWFDYEGDTVLLNLATHRRKVDWLRKAPHAHIVNLGSIAGFEVYKGGAGYTATKHAVRAISRTLRLELNGEPIRVTEVAPGMVETEFSLVRFKGDQQTADNEYKGVQPLVAEDIADVIAFCVTRPPHVNIDEVVVRPIAQAAAYLVARKES